MVRMSLVPSESASFPDLVGQVHGYRHPNARRPSLRRKATRLPSSQPSPNNPENELESLGPAESSGTPEGPKDDCEEVKTFASPSPPPPPENTEADRVELESLAPFESSEPPESLEDNRGVFEIPAPPSFPPPPENAQPDRVDLEPLPPLDSPEPRENPDDNRGAIETAIPPAAPPPKPGMNRAEGAFQLELPLPFISRNVENSYLVRAPLPVPRQRSVAQMRSKIQPQEAAPSVPANRPRTPVRGLTINRPAPIVVEKPAHPLSARFPLLNLPRHRLVKLVRFIVCETLAVGVLVLAMLFGFVHQLANDPLALVLKVLAVVAAVAAIMVPVIFYGLPKISPRSQR
jgi:hypothetical protein